MKINHNMAAFNSNRMLNLVNTRKGKHTERLSSGYKINRSADDASGLAISEKMRRQIRGLRQASLNSQDGISMVQTAEGGLNEVHEILHRMNELSVKAANGTLTEEDRRYADEEFQNLKSEINRVADTVTFNEIQLFPSDGSGLYVADYDISVSADGTSKMTFKTDAYTVGNVASTASAKETAKYVADLIPATISSILNAYPSLKGADDLSIDLSLSYIDGPNNTLAYASYRYYNGGDYAPLQDSFLVKIDTADFTDENALDGGDRNDLLKATMAHELTHTVMQYNLSKSMATDLPQWFKEGAAQMSGGGFSTGWLSEIANITEGLVSGDSSKDDALAANLKKYTVDGRPYGHGFLATAYAAYLADGSNTVDASHLANGLDKIFDKLKKGSSFADAIRDTTGKTVSEIKSAINKGSADAVKFVREYAIASGTGAGSVLSSLSAGSQLMGGSPSATGVPLEQMAAANVVLQVGAEPEQEIEFSLFSIGTMSLGLYTANILEQDSAVNAIEGVKNALTVISSIRSYYGAIQNRLEHTVNNLDNVAENTTAAESLIRDTDMSKEMVEYSNHQILEQVGTAMLSQANQSNQGVLTLLQ